MNGKRAEVQGKVTISGHLCGDGFHSVSFSCLWLLALALFDLILRVCTEDERAMVTLAGLPC